MALVERLGDISDKVAVDFQGELHDAVRTQDASYRRASFEPRVEGVNIHKFLHSHEQVNRCRHGFSP